MTHLEIFLNAFKTNGELTGAFNGNTVLIPPVKDFGYRSTPLNALTFASMDVDGVHYAVLTQNGNVSNASPVIQVSPMDEEDVIILAPSFLDYLADGCGVSKEKIESVFAAEIDGKRQLVHFLLTHFENVRMLDEERIRDLLARFGSLIERKPESA